MEWTIMSVIVFCIGLGSYSVQGFHIPKSHRTSGQVSDDRGIFTAGWETEGEVITFRVTANTTGYVGIGFTATGSMGGADIFIGGVYENGTTYGGVSWELIEKLKI
jgi:hypothetical protein